VLVITDSSSGYNKIGADNVQSCEDRKRQENKKILNLNFEILLGDIPLHLWMYLVTSHVLQCTYTTFTPNGQDLLLYSVGC
jgi:hypothetical protein